MMNGKIQTTVELATWFLDGVMQEFIDKSSGRESLITNS